MKQQLPKRFTRSQLDNNHHQVNNTKVSTSSNKRRQNSHKSKVTGSAPSSKLKGRVTRSQIANNNSNSQTLIESRQDDEDEELKDNKMSSIPSSTNNVASSATNNNSDTKRANETSSSLKPPPSSTQPPQKKEVETPEQIAFRASYPLTNISEPTNNDCLFGRGGGTNHHPGNKHYRSIVDAQKQRYLNSKRLDKPMVAMVSC